MLIVAAVTLDYFFSLDIVYTIFTLLLRCAMRHARLLRHA